MKASAVDESLRRRHYFEQVMDSAEVFPFVTGEAAVFSRRCPGGGTACEDAAAVIPFGDRGGVLVVADGLGGQPAGDRASNLAVQWVERSLVDAAQRGLELREAVLNGFESANRAVSQLMMGAATTLAVVEIQGRTVRPYHAGDSVIMVVGQRGRIKLQTVSHSPVGYAVEAGFLDQEEAMHHEERHLVSNMLGSQEMHITIGPPLHLSDRDTLLVASDGLADNLHVHEIVDRVRKGPMGRVAEQLSGDALDRMNTPQAGWPSKPDDLTFIVYRPCGKRASVPDRAMAGAV